MQIAELEYALDDSILTQRILWLRIGAKDVCDFADKAASKLRRRMQIGGFRKDRAPLSVVRKHYWTRLRHEVFEELKRAALAQVYKLLEEKDQPFLPPEVVLDRELPEQVSTFRQPLAQHATLSPLALVTSPDDANRRHPVRRLRYGEPLEFAVKYLVDPGGASKRPEMPDFSHQSVDQGRAQPGLGMGIPSGPQLPGPLGMPGLPGMPAMPGAGSLYQSAVNHEGSDF